ncbi:MAG: NAD-dependent epimerase/dehydratase family protein, partial [Candidatus Hodarchaeota archaeon]
MKILITGGLGFIGSSLGKYLVDREHEITLLSRSKRKISNISEFKDNVEVLILPVEEIKEEVKDFDVIFHFASSVDNYAIIENDLNRDININCKGTLNLLDACQKYNRKCRLIFGSSFFVVGKPKKLPVDETAECNPLSLYAATRLCGEHFCKIYRNIFGLKTIIVRFVNVFGEKEQFTDKKKAAFNYMIGQVLQGKPITMYDDGLVKRDYIHISDVVRACEVIMNKGIDGETYFVGRGEGIMLKNLFEMIIEETPESDFIPKAYYAIRFIELNESGALDSTSHRKL